MPGPLELSIIFGIVLLIFGGKKLRSLGGDLGGAISEFKNSMSNEDEEENTIDESASATTSEKSEAVNE